MKIHSLIISTCIFFTSLAYAQNKSIEELISEVDFSKEGVIVSEQEKEAVISSMKLARNLAKLATEKNGYPYRRDVHVKGTGCVRAEFSVNGDIPKRFQHSIFSDPGQTYLAWVRFSNGDTLVNPDKKADARGMAIKVMGVTGEKIAPEFSGAATQDFLMINNPVFFNRNIFDYADDMRYLSKLERTKWFISLFPPRFHPRELQRAAKIVSKKINTPFEPQYYSMLPYQLGQTDIKFSAKACNGMVFNEKPNKDNKDYLTEIMQEKLMTQGACFDFMVQPKVAGANMPLDNAIVRWSEEASPFIPIARLQIPPQDIMSEEQMKFCENLSMNPWHGVGDWLPKGSLSRGRRLVYHIVSSFRHDNNKVKSTQPINWCLNGAKDCDNAKTVNVTKSKWPLPRCFDSLYRPLDNKEFEDTCESAN